MAGFTTLLDIFLHLDKYLSGIIAQYGLFTYFILFFVIFLETGIVIFPFLPGDSLLFVAGAIAAIDSLNIILLFIILCLAAILGDTVNYWVGYFIGEKTFKRETRFIKKEYLYRTQNFYDKHGGKTIVIARFVPIIRTFAPFIAGVGRMNYKRFLSYNVFGGVLWVALFVFSGYWFGNIPAVKDNFGFAILAIIVISLLPLIIEVMKSRRKNKS